MDPLTPVIVSASRATDIPALYGAWLLRRLQAGSCVWINRFNGRRQRVSFERTRAIVFWSKNPAPLIPRLGEIDALGINYYFTFTLNDYEREGLEPGLPPLAERIETFCRLSQLLGRDRVVWRFDPIIVGRRLTPEAILDRIARVGAAVHRHTRKLVISFADVARYPAARRRAGRPTAAASGNPARGQTALIAAGIRELNRAWGLDVAACAEAVDLAELRHRPEQVCRRRAAGAGVSRGRGAHGVSRAGRGQRAAARRRCDGGVAHRLKDRGQRTACGCIVSKDIGRYGTCTHGCVYCYGTPRTRRSCGSRPPRPRSGEALTGPGPR